LTKKLPVVSPGQQIKFKMPIVLQNEDVGSKVKTQLYKR